MAFKVTMSFRMTAVIDDFGRLAVPFKFIGEEAHDGIVLDGDERRHIERLADSGSPRLDMARLFPSFPLSSFIGARRAMQAAPAFVNAPISGM